MVEEERPSWGDVGQKKGDHRGGGVIEEGRPSWGGRGRRRETIREEGVVEERIPSWWEGFAEENFSLH